MDTLKKTNRKALEDAVKRVKALIIQGKWDTCRDPWRSRIFGNVRERQDSGIVDDLALTNFMESGKGSDKQEGEWGCEVGQLVLFATSLSSQVSGKSWWGMLQI